MQTGLMYLDLTHSLTCRVFMALVIINHPIGLLQKRTILYAIDGDPKARVRLSATTSTQLRLYIGLTTFPPWSCGIHKYGTGPKNPKTRGDCKTTTIAWPA